MKTLIRNGIVYLDDCKFHKGNLIIQGQRILDFNQDEETTAQIIEAEGMYVIPGLVDLHLHGCDGVDFCDGTEEAIGKIVDYETKHGITSLCPATMTLQKKELVKIVSAFRTYQHKHGNRLAGMNLEGPFINPDKRGAQAKENCILPDLEFFKELQEASGNGIKLVTVAPELEGAERFIRCISEFVTVSIGHSVATYEQAWEAFAWGASHVTHLYNGMEVWNHRAPGIPGAALDAGQVFVELICDGNHLHPSVIRSAWKEYGGERIVLISDSTMAAGLDDGEYTLGGQRVFCKGNRVTNKSGVLAGSASNLFDCVRYVCQRSHLPMEEVVKCATINPARVLKIHENYGSIRKGKYANIVIMNPEMELCKVIYKGKVYWEKK